jgi:hypothetical protein
MRVLLAILTLVPLLCRADFSFGVQIVARYNPEPMGLVPWEIVGPTAKHVNFVVVSEGYTKDQLHQFPLDALRLKNVYQTVEPYRQHAQDINWFLLYVASNESGADKPGITKDTAFGAMYNTGGMRRLISVDGAAFWTIWSMVSGTFATWKDFLPIVLVNDSEYGGGGGNPTTVSVDSSSGWIAIHEDGHRFGHLGDEYQAPYPGFPVFEQPNVAISLSHIPWQDMLDAHVPGVGIYEGAGFVDKGKWRPSITCLMRDLNTHTFDPVCERAIETQIQKRLQ